MKIEIKSKLYFAIIFASILFSCNNKVYKVTGVETKYIKISEDLKGVEEIENFIKPYHDTVEMKLNKTISYTKGNLWTKRKGKKTESPLGNLLSDLVLEQANIRYDSLFSNKADISVLNKGGIRTSIGKGDITLRQMFEIMPFNNTLLVVTISPAKMEELIEYMVKSNGHPMANIKIKVANGKASDIKIGGHNYDENKNYKIVTTDYLQHGGDKMYFFSNPIKIDTLNYLMRDAMIDYFEKTDTVDVKLDGRFSYAK